jgi:hypothetical protein
MPGLAVSRVVEKVRYNQGSNDRRRRYGEFRAMPIETYSEIVTFYEFLGRQIQEGSVALSPEESVEAFRAYQRDLSRLKRELQPGLDRCDRGEPGVSFDAEDIIRRGRERLASEGIAAAIPPGYPAAP